MTVDLFIPCFIDQFYPETAFNTIKVLEKAGCTVQYNPNQTCCGQPSFNSGDVKETKKLAKKFLNDFDGENYIVSPGGSCTGFIKNYYENIFTEDAEKSKSISLKNRIFDITDFLVNILKISDLNSTFPHKVTFHDSCSALREYGLKNEPRLLLSHVKGLELVELENNTTCCGFGGTFSMKHSSISTAMVEQKVEFALKTGAEYITSTEASCLMNIAAYIKAQNISLKPIHIVDILAGGL